MSFLINCSQVLVHGAKNELREHTGSKQAKSLVQESKQLPGQTLGGGGRVPLLPIILWRFLFLKDGGTNVGSRYLDLGLAQYLYHPIGTLELGMLPEFYDPFALLSLLSYRGFYPLKMWGGVTNVGSRKMWFSPIGLAQLPLSVLVQ